MDWVFFKIGMKKEIIIDKHGIGNAVLVLEDDRIIDCFIDPPLKADFYPPDTFVKANVDRKVSNIGGYFVKLPNGKQGLLKSKNKYKEGMSVIMSSKVIHDPLKPQVFSDILKTITKYFVIKTGEKGVSFSKKIPERFDKVGATSLLTTKLRNLENIFVICRSSIANINFLQLDVELEKALAHIKEIKFGLEKNHIYFDGLARKVSLERYDAALCKITEEEGIFERLGLWDKLEEIKGGRVALKGGSNIIFEQTSAFLTIDVNSGNFLKKNNKELNLRACKEILRMIRIFGLGGKILIDFLPCSQKVKREIYDNIFDFFSDDQVRSKILGWTKGGIFELERKREKIPFKLLFQDY